MNHVWTIAWRPAHYCVHGAKTATGLLGFRQASSVLARGQKLVIPTRDAHLAHAQNSFRSVTWQCQFASRPLCTTAAFRFENSSRCQEQIPPRAPSELAFRRSDLRPYEAKAIFGSNAPPIALANTLLKVLHSRRVNGTLDLDLPPKLDSQIRQYPGAIEDALRWLRREYPIDEDAAILRRIEREDAGYGDEALIHRAEDLGLYKPQSGLYGVKLGEGGDVYGESQLEKLSKAKELSAKKEEEELERLIEEKQRAVEEKVGGLATIREDGVEVSTQVRPPNSFERWGYKHYLLATSKITYEEATKKGKLRRLFPSFVFAATVIYGSYMYAATWTPPDRATRMMPSQTLSNATILGIISVNVGLFVLWRFPPAWRILNRYFITTTGVVRPLSHLGNIFSHQLFAHLGGNMLLLWMIGRSLHEQIGRGDFLAIYLASGVVGSVASLTNMVLRNMLHTSSLGASGAVTGILAAFCTINPDAKITFWILPDEWATWLSYEARTLLVVFIAFEVLSLTVPFLHRKNIDYVAHLGGYAVGIVGGLLWKREHGGNTVVGPWGANRSRDPRWYERFLGR